ncbi:MAG: FAD-dependent oxidoreductase [Thermomicrobiales bacterium]
MAAYSSRRRERGRKTDEYRRTDYGAEEEADVVIVGAGPVGLTLAIDLAQRGVEVVVLELRKRGEPPSVKCNHVSARSMEIFRRLGIVEAIRNAGLPPDYPHDIAFRTTMTGQEIARVKIPSRSQRYIDSEGVDSGWPTPEPPHRINQIYMEPIMFEYAWQVQGLTILNRTRYLEFGAR